MSALHGVRVLGAYDAGVACAAVAASACAYLAPYAHRQQTYAHHEEGGAR